MPSTRRSTAVFVAAALLVVEGLLLVVHNAVRGTMGFDVLFAVVVLLLVAAGLVWGGVVGYWASLAVLALPTVAAVSAVVDRPTVTGGIAIGVLAVTLVLLLVELPSGVAAARAGARSFRSWARRPPSAQWPDGWTPEFLGGWGTFALLIVLGGISAPAGLRTWFDPGVSGVGSTVGGLVLGAFGLVCLGVLPNFYPGPRRGHAQARTLRVGERSERGVAFPYSLLRTSGAGLAAVPMTLLSLGVTVQPEAPLGARIAGVVGVGFFGPGVGYLVVRRGVFRRWWVVLTPSTVAFLQGRARTLVPWTALADVVAFEVTVTVRGTTNRTPMIGLIPRDRAAVETGRLNRALMPLNRRLGAEVGLPVRPLAVDPVRVYQVLRFYHRNPDARAELDTHSGLDRARA